MRLLVGVALGALVLATSASAQTASFTGNVCKFVPTAKVTAIPGVSAKCAETPAALGLGSKIYVGDWAGKSAKSPTVQVTISHYTDSGALQLATRNLKQGLPGGTPKALTGIGAKAYEATAAFSTGIHFLVGKYIVYLSVNDIGKNPTVAERTPFEALAKAVAAKL